MTIECRPSGPRRPAVRRRDGRGAGLVRFPLKKTLADCGLSVDTWKIIQPDMGGYTHQAASLAGLTGIECYMPVTLDQMKKGTRGKIVSVVGGRGVALKLSAQGISPGMMVEKISALRGGPVVLRVGRSRVAIGIGLARKVLVEVDEA